MPSIATTDCLYFGTFNPIHTGHLMIAQSVLRQFSGTLGLKRVVFVPAGDPPHRYHEDDLLDARRRFKMVSLAIAGNPAFAVSDIELRRAAQDNTLTYTIDTLQQLIQAHGLTRPIPMIIGADALAGLASWREPEALIETVHFLQAPRPEHDWVHTIQLDGRTIPLTTTPIDMPALSLSSSWVRRQLRQGPNALNALRYFLPEPVRQYIQANQLYGS